MSSGPNYVRRPAAPARSGGPEGLADVLERVLDKGLVIAGDIQINLLDIELLTIKVRLLLASADTAQQMGIDWWKHDPFLSGRDRELAQENAVLRERVDALEASLGRKLAPGEPSPGDLVGEGATDREAHRGQTVPTGALGGTASAGAEGEQASDEVELEPAGEAETLVVTTDEGEVTTSRAHVRPSDEGLEGLTKAQLQERLRAAGKPVSGTKAQLVQRLRE